ncbi:MAG: radical SAM protein [Nanoarchaeota archaeon]|nr:radical SAM protein [Nanoarchaeota archaeon]MBU1854286.1 radical SAM protein [Nanoarchaeota archaeon]
MQAFIAELIVVGSVEFTNELYTKIYFSGCDFRCPYCNKPHMLETKPEQQTEIREIYNKLENQRETVEGVLLTGGEPCFQKQALIEICKKAKELKLKTVLDTNGSKPEVIEALLKNELIDIIIMDFKASLKQDFNKATNSATFFKSTKKIIKDIKQTLEILKAYDEKTEIIFNTTIVPGLIYKKEELLEIAEEIKNINAAWQLQPFTNETVKDKRYQDIIRPTSSFIENLKEAIRKEYPKMRIN